MSIFDIFKPATPAAAAPANQPVQPAATTPGNIPDSAAAASQGANTAATAPNGVVPVNDATAGAAKTGLDAFADIWNTEAKPGTQGQPLFNVDQAKMLESARKQNFTGQAATKEQMDAIVKGGPEAAQAMLEIMNAVSQNVYAQSTFATTRLIEGAAEKAGFARTSDIDARVKNITLTNTLHQENPVFAHPAAQPLLDSVKSQLMVKYPNATPNELATMARTYLTEFANAANAPAAQQQQQQQQQAAKGDDWSRFLENGKIF